jgi:hypothetical protein
VIGRFFYWRGNRGEDVQNSKVYGITKNLMKR